MIARKALQNITPVTSIFHPDQWIARKSYNVGPPSDVNVGEQVSPSNERSLFAYHKL